MSRLGLVCTVALLAAGCGGADTGSDAVGELVVARDDGVYAIDLESGDERPIGSVERYGGAWSPSGRKVAVGDGDTILVTTVASGASERFDTSRCYPSAWAPDETIIACANSDPWVLATLDLETGETRTLTDASETSLGPSWSPDSRSIAYAGSGIMVMDRDGSGKRRVAIGHADQQLGGPAWSPDGRRIAFLNDEGVSIVNAVGGKSNVLLETGGRATYGPAWSPDGRYLAVTHGDGDYELFVIDVDGGETRNVTDNERTHDRGVVWSPDSRHVAYRSEGEDGRGFFVAPVEGGGPRLVWEEREGVEDRVEDSILHWLAPPDSG